VHRFELSAAAESAGASCVECGVPKNFHNRLTAGLHERTWNTDVVHDPRGTERERVARRAAVRAAEVLGGAYVEAVA